MGSILELGCETGRLTTRWPDASVTAVDAAQEMLDVARQRVDDANAPTARVRLVRATFDEYTAPAETYDIIAANWSLHHVVDKGPFYARLRGMLAPRGVLAIGDEVVAEPAKAHARLQDEWLASVRQPGRLSEDELAGLMRHDAEFDHPETLGAHFAMLAAAGFDACNSAVIVAVAPG